MRCWMRVCVMVLVAVLQTPQASASTRVALVIGNAAYSEAPALANPVNDANDMAAALTKAGFKVVLGLDLDKRSFDRTIRDFSRMVADADAALLFYAGHGLQVGGRNYLVPIDAKLESERDLDFETVPLEFLLRQMELDREGRTNIVFLDACRDNPLSRNLARSMGTRSASIGQGLAQVQTGIGTFISYSTQPGNVALDGQGRNSPFTSALVKALAEPGRSLTATMIEVRKEVLATTKGRQVPWDHSSLTGEFYLHNVALPGLGQRPDVDPKARDLQSKVEELEKELKRRTDPQVAVARVRVEQLRERIRQIDEANRADQQKLFEVQRQPVRPGDAEDHAKRNREIGNIQITRSRRSQERATLAKEMEDLEKTLAE
jgi:hypothetical protein